MSPNPRSFVRDRHSAWKDCLNVFLGNTLGVPLVALEADSAVPAARGAVPLEPAALAPALRASVGGGAALDIEARRRWRHGWSGRVRNDVSSESMEKYLVRRCQVAWAGVSA